MRNLPRHKHLTIRETKKGQTLRKKSQNPPPKKPRYLVQVLPKGRFWAGNYRVSQVCANISHFAKNDMLYRFRPPIPGCAKTNVAGRAPVSRRDNPKKSCGGLFINGVAIVYHSQLVAVYHQADRNTHLRCDEIQGRCAPLMIYTALRAVVIYQACRLGYKKKNHPNGWFSFCCEC